MCSLDVIEIDAFFCTGTREGAALSVTYCGIGISTRTLRKTFSDLNTIIGTDFLKAMIAMAEVLNTDYLVLKAFCSQHDPNLDGAAAKWSDLQLMSYATPNWATFLTNLWPRHDYDDYHEVCLSWDAILGSIPHAPQRSLTPIAGLCIALGHCITSPATYQLSQTMLPANPTFWSARGTFIIRWWRFQPLKAPSVLTLPRMDTSWMNFQQSNVVDDFKPTMSMLTSSTSAFYQTPFCGGIFCGQKLRHCIRPIEAGEDHKWRSHVILNTKSEKVVKQSTFWFTNSVHFIQMLQDGMMRTPNSR